MFHRLLPAALCILTTASVADTLILPGQEDPDPNDTLPECENRPYDKSNCVRVLACLGGDGLWFDGQAHGWDTGIVLGHLNTGTPCTGTWSANGPLGTGFSRLTCENGLSADVIYYSQHNETGTVIGHGMDSTGRALRVWTGLNVLEFLTPDQKSAPELPCTATPIPISALPKALREKPETQDSTTGHSARYRDVEGRRA